MRLCFVDCGKQAPECECRRELQADLLTHGVSIMQGNERIDPRDFFVDVEDGKGEQ